MNYYYQDINTHGFDWKISSEDVIKILAGSATSDKVLLDGTTVEAAIYGTATDEPEEEGKLVAYRIEGRWVFVPAAFRLTHTLQYSK